MVVWCWILGASRPISAAKTSRNETYEYPGATGELLTTPLSFQDRNESWGNFTDKRGGKGGWRAENSGPKMWDDDCDLRGKSNNQYIVNGEDASKGEFPFAVSLRIVSEDGTGFHHVCGGTLIKKNWVLTAGHCVINEKLAEHWRTGRVRARVGSIYRSDNSKAQGVEQYIRRYLVHAGFPTKKDGNMPYDIALLELENPVEKKLTNQEPIVSWACAETSNDVKQITVIGWGDTVGIDQEPNKEGSRILKKVEQEVKDDSFCKATARQIDEYYSSDNQFCAYGERKDSCVGDSGGPALSIDKETGAYKVYGIVSFGPRICASQGLPGFYLKVPVYVNWVSTTLEKAVKDPNWKGDNNNEASQRGPGGAAPASIHQHSSFDVLIICMVLAFILNLNQ